MITIKTEDLNRQLGIIMPSKEPRKRREAPDDFLLRYFSPLEACKINFVPVMLRSLVMRAASELADVLRDSRVSELKKHTRLLRDTVKQSEKYDLWERGFDKVRDYKYYTDEYYRRVAGRCWLFVKNLEEQAMKDKPQRHRTVCAMTTYVALIATFARTYELEMNKLISSRCGETVSKAPDMYPTLVSAICVDIAETFGYDLGISRDSKLWVQILSNDALELCTEMYNKEYAEAAQQSASAV